MPIASLALLVAVAPISAAPSAQGREVLPADPFLEQALDRRQSADGSLVVYGAAFDGGPARLWLALEPAGIPPLELSRPMVAGGEVRGEYGVSASGELVVYLADSAVDERVELFVVLSDGSGPALRLEHALADGEDVLDFQRSKRMPPASQPSSGAPGEGLLGRGRVDPHRMGPCRCSAMAWETAGRVESSPRGTEARFRPSGFGNDGTTAVRRAYPANSSSGGERAGARVGTAVGSPRCSRILRTTLPSVMTAMSLRLRPLP